MARFQRGGSDVSVLTAASQGHLVYLEEAYVSLRRERDIEWEWVIQLDGWLRPEAILASVRADPRVTVEANACHLGAATTRNRALTRCRADLVQNLDADDVLLLGSLRCAADVLKADPGLAFTFGRTADLMPDGRVVHKWDAAVPFAPGRIEAGELDNYWLSVGHDPIPISPLMWRKVRIYEAGGWSALSSLEDASLMYAVASRWPCYYIDRETQLWRVHKDQVTQSEAFRSDAGVNRSFMYQRIMALRQAEARLADSGAVD